MEKVSKKFMRTALALFVSTVVAVIILQSFVFGHGFNMHWSISRYMGTSVWSAIVFAISNLAIIIMMVNYLKRLRKKYGFSKLWFAIVVIMIASFAMLSICPVGLFDANWGDYGVVSTIHRNSSYVLFGAMFAIAIDTLIEHRKRSRLLTIYGIFLLAYAVFSFFGYIYAPHFYIDYILFYEAAYIIFNIIFYGLIPE